MANIDIAAPGASRGAMLAALQSSGLLFGRLFGMYGDSRAGGGQVFASRTGNQIHPWIEALSGGRVRIPGTLCHGRSGFTPTQLADPIYLTPAVEAMRDAGAVGVFLIMSTNGRKASGGETAAQSIAAMLMIETAFRAAGLLVVWLGEYPRGSTSFPSTTVPNGDGNIPAFTTTLLAQHYSVVRWLRSRALVPGVIVVDTIAALTDRITTANEQAGFWINALTYDGVHPTTLGAYFIAKAVVAAIAVLLGPSNLFKPSASNEVYDAVTGTGAITFNPTMSGASGSLNGNAGAAPANGWVAGTPVSGITATYSKVVVEGREWQQIVYSGTGPAGPLTHNALQRDTNYGVNGVAAGKSYMIVGEYEVDAGAMGVFKINPTILDNNPSAAWSAADASTSYGGVPNEVHRPVFISDPFLLAGSGSIRSALSIGFVPSATVALTIRIGTLATLPV